MLDILRDNPLLLLFIVAGIGYPLGRVRIGGIHLGVAAVLFVGLAFGALDPSLKLPEIVYQFGLALFVYCVGLSSGHGFLRSFRGKGVIYNLLTLGVILLAAALLLIPHYLLSLRPGETAGVFAGLLTSTPALAAAVEYLTRAGAAGQLSDPVVGYSIAYPASVLGVILAIYLAERCFRIDYRAEARTLKDVPGVSPEITCWTLRVCRPKAFGRTVRDLVAEHRLQVVFGRIRRGDHADVVSWETHLEEGDLVTAVGPVEELERAAQVIGCVSEVQADLDRSEVDMREVFVSNPEVAGRTLRELNLPNRFGAVVSRVWRGDLQLLPYADMPLELGDRVRVLSRRERQQEVAAYLGDSYRAISEIDIAVLGLGMALGIGLGLVPIPLPGGITVRLGLAGGPLIVALFLGARQRTGSLVWVLPYSANMLLRQMGLTIFLAAVGTRSGYEFAQMLTQPRGWSILGASAAIIVLLSWVMLYVGYRWLRIPMGLLTGMVAGMQTQSATLGFALDQAGNDLPTVGYAMVYPMAMVVKIVLAPVLLALLT
ncbi:aspartate:alanine exchanger family transporter [Symbiobacterium thermophilum]|uniref:aspartate:alanine exchanger family transporter n=1 Tax=Symbiobacterium thermophilum TaxID=2734 RepID=UPI0035C6F2BF